jgi:hypothetical protein
MANGVDPLSGIPALFVDPRDKVDPLSGLPAQFFDPRTAGNFSQAVAPTGIQNIEDLIRQVSPEAIGLVEGGARTAADLTSQATQQAIGGLQPFAGTEALQEQRALLGLGGLEAQQAAIAGIPVSGAQQEAQRRERETQLRRAAAGGGLGSGATLLGAQQLAGAQQSSNIFNRLSELGGLTDVSQRARSSISGLLEAGGAREAALLGGIGPQISSILLGGAAPIVQARQQQAELSGLRGIASANQRSQILGQLAQLGGQFFGQGGGDAFAQTAGQFGTVPGSQQTSFLQEQQAGLF